MLQDTTDAQIRELSVAKNRTENKCLMTKMSARKVGSTDLRWSKFVGTGKERNAFFPVSFPFPFFSRSFPRTSLFPTVVASTTASTSSDAWLISLSSLAHSVCLSHSDQPLLRPAPFATHLKLLENRAEMVDHSDPIIVDSFYYSELQGGGHCMSQELKKKS